MCNVARWMKKKQRIFGFFSEEKLEWVTSTWLSYHDNEANARARKYSEMPRTSELSPQPRRTNEETGLVEGVNKHCHLIVRSMTHKKSSSHFQFKWNRDELSGFMNKSTYYQCIIISDGWIVWIPSVIYLEIIWVASMLFMWIQWNARTNWIRKYGKMILCDFILCARARVCLCNM